MSTFVFGIHSSILGVSSQRPGISGPAGGASDGYRLGEELLDRAAGVLVTV